MSHDNVNRIIKQTATPIVKNGKLEGILAVSTDVTNEECLKAKLIAKNYQLNTLLISDIKSILLRNIIH